MDQDLLGEGFGRQNGIVKDVSAKFKTVDAQYSQYSWLESKVLDTHSVQFNVPSRFTLAIMLPSPQQYYIYTTISNFMPEGLDLKTCAHGVTTQLSGDMVPMRIKSPQGLYKHN